MEVYASSYFYGGQTDEISLIIGVLFGEWASVNAPHQRIVIYKWLETWALDNILLLLLMRRVR